jgi:AcrR family transcriptional regulator
MANTYLPTVRRRQDTVEAVIELAGRQNLHTLTISAIAAHMELSQSALFRHFPNKEAIWEEVMSWVSDKLLHQVDGIIVSTPDPLAALEALFFNHLAFAASHPGVPRILFGELQKVGITPAKKKAQQLLDSYSRRLSACIERGKQLGQVPSTIETASAIALFFGTIQGLILQAMLSGNMAGLPSSGQGLFTIYRRGISACNINVPVL